MTYNVSSWKSPACSHFSLEFAVWQSILKYKWMTYNQTGHVVCCQTWNRTLPCEPAHFSNHYTSHHTNPSCVLERFLQWWLLQKCHCWCVHFKLCWCLDLMWDVIYFCGIWKCKGHAPSGRVPSSLDTVYVVWNNTDCQ